MTKTRKNKKIRVDIRMLDGKRISKVFSRKIDADKFRTERQVEKYRAQANGISINNFISFKDFATEWFNTEVKNRKSDQTQRNYECELRNYILSVVGTVKLRDINIRHPRTIENNMLALVRHPRTINKVLMVFKTILNDAVKSNHLLKNPIKGYAELREPPRTIKFWNKEDAAKFLEHTKNDSLYSLYVTALNTGMRLGEALGLCWDKIDFENNHIVVSRCLGRSGLRDTTKTHEARYIPMNKNLRILLDSLYKNRISEKYIFCKPNGNHLDYNHVTLRSFKRSQVECGITKIIRFHDLRHTFASHFMMN